MGVEVNNEHPLGTVATGCGAPSASPLTVQYPPPCLYPAWCRPLESDPAIPPLLSTAITASRTPPVLASTESRRQRPLKPVRARKISRCTSHHGLHITSGWISLSSSTVASRGLVNTTPGISPALLATNRAFAGCRTLHCWGCMSCHKSFIADYDEHIDEIRHSLPQGHEMFRSCIVGFLNFSILTCRILNSPSSYPLAQQCDIARKGEHMKPLLSFDKTVMTAQQGDRLHTLIELQAPPAPNVQRAPLDVVFVIDRSGSMSGRPIEAVREAVIGVMRQLGPEDRAGVVAFDTNASMILPIGKHTSATVQHKVGQIHSGSSTNLSAGWLMANEMLRKDQRAAAMRRIILLTDGHVNQGIVSEDELATMVSAGRQSSITPHSLGLLTATRKICSALLRMRVAVTIIGAKAQIRQRVFQRELEGLRQWLHRTWRSPLRQLTQLPCWASSMTSM